MLCPAQCLPWRVVEAFAPCALRTGAASRLLLTSQSPRNAAQGFPQRRQHPLPTSPLSNPQAPRSTLGPLGAPHSGVGASSAWELLPSPCKCDLGRPLGLGSRGALRIHFWKSDPDTGAVDGEFGAIITFPKVLAIGGNPPTPIFYPQIRSTDFLKPTPLMKKKKPN